MQNEAVFCLINFEQQIFIKISIDVFLRMITLSGDDRVINYYYIFLNFEGFYES